MSVADEEMCIYCTAIVRYYEHVLLLTVSAMIAELIVATVLYYFTHITVLKSLFNLQVHNFVIFKSVEALSATRDNILRNTRTIIGTGMPVAWFKQITHTIQLNIILTLVVGFTCWSCLLFIFESLFSIPYVWWRANPTNASIRLLPFLVIYTEDPIRGHAITHTQSHIVSNTPFVACCVLKNK